MSTNVVKAGSIRKIILHCSSPIYKNQHFFRLDLLIFHYGILLMSLKFSSLGTFCTCDHDIACGINDGMMLIPKAGVVNHFTPCGTC